jgi:hypothetical protein
MAEGDEVNVGAVKIESGATSVAEQVGKDRGTRRRHTLFYVSRGF